MVGRLRSKSFLTVFSSQKHCAQCVAFGLSLLVPVTDTQAYEQFSSGKSAYPTSGGEAAHGSKAKKATTYATGKLVLSDKVKEKAKGIKTMFVSIYNSEKGSSPVLVKKDVFPNGYAEAKRSFTFTSENMYVMMKSDEKVSKIDIKVTLSKSGNAGPPTQDDIVGWKTGVKVGATGVDIRLPSSK